MILDGLTTPVEQPGGRAGSATSRSRSRQTSVIAALTELWRAQLPYFIVYTLFDQHLFVKESIIKRLTTASLQR